MPRGTSLKALWWTTFIVACLMPTVLGLVEPSWWCGDAWVIALLVATAALALALRTQRLGVLRALPFAVVGALSGIVLPLESTALLLEPDPGCYLSDEAPSGERVLVMDRTGKLAFGTEPVTHFVLLRRGLGGFSGGVWTTLDGSSSFENVTIWKPWPGSSDLLLEQKARVARYRRAYSGEACRNGAVEPRHSLQR